MIKSVTAFITTDGKVHVNKEDAIKHQNKIELTVKAIKFAKQYYPEDIDPVVDIVINWEQNKPAPGITLSQLGLNQRIYLALNSENVTTVEELVKHTPESLEKFTNMNVRLVNEIKEALAKHSLSLFNEGENDVQS